MKWHVTHTGAAARQIDEPHTKIKAVAVERRRHVDRRDFDRMKKGGDLLEWAEVHGNGYGTPRAPVEKVLAEGRDMLFDVDWQGAKQVRERVLSETPCPRHAS